MSNITIKDLAEKLQLSIGTVSKALRDSHEISPQTKERVQAMARKFHYAPNPHASSLRRKKSNTIAVVVPEVADSFFSMALKGIESVAESKGYHVLVYLTYESFYRERSILSDFMNGRVDGVMISVSSETSNSRHIEALNNAGIPIVFFDRTLEDIETVKIVTNDYESSYAATMHLLNNDCRRIAYLSISKHLDINNRRKEGYLQALKSQKITDNIVLNCSNNLKYNVALLQKLMQEIKRPDGMIASVEKLTIPVYEVCRQLQIAIPEQLKVVSFSNFETASILAPPLTTITQPAFDMGRTAATHLFRALSSKKSSLKNETIMIPSQLIVRSSTRNAETKSK